MSSKLLSKAAAAAVFGAIWWLGNIYYGNMVALDMLGWLTAFPWWVQWVVAILPSAGQLYLEENWGAQDDEGPVLDWATKGMISVTATGLDLGGPAMGIMATTAAAGVPVGILPAIAAAFLVSWVAQHIAWRALKQTLRELNGELFGTKTAKRRRGEHVKGV